MKKRILAAVIAGLMVVSMAAGCANPKVTLGQYKGLEVTDVSQAELETRMQEILEEHAEWVAVLREAVEGDTYTAHDTAGDCLQECCKRTEERKGDTHKCCCCNCDN